MDPFERHHLIQKPQILSVRVILAIRQMGQVEEAKDTEPVCDGDDDDIGVLFHKIVAVKHRIDRTARFKSAAVDPYHDRFLPGSCLIRLPYIQIQAVLIHIVKGTRLQLPIPVGAFRVVIRLINSVIRNNVYRSFPAQRTDGLFSDKGNAPIHDDILCLPANESPVFALDRQRRIIIAVCDGLVLAAVHGSQHLSHIIRCHRLLRHFTHCTILLVIALLLEFALQTFFRPL